MTECIIMLRVLYHCKAEFKDAWGNGDSGRCLRLMLPRFKSSAKYSLEATVSSEIV